MKSNSLNTPSLFESLESRLFFSVIPASAVAVYAKKHPTAASANTSVPVSNGTGVTGEYFSGNNFQTPLVVRNDNVINFAWTRARPDQDVPKGIFSAQWTGQIEAPVTGTYTFYTNSDSGTSLTINGVTLINQLAGHGEASGTIALTAGQKYSLQVQYISRGRGTSKVQLLWSAPGVNKQLVPKSALFPDSSVALPPTALTGTYYLGLGFTSTPIMTRADTAIDFNWGTGSPDHAIPQHVPFSVKWTGQITAPTTGVYTFKSIADDGVKLYVNGQLVINNFHLDSGFPHKGTISLQAGQTYSLEEDYFENGSENASARLVWALPGQHYFVSYVPFSAPVPVAPTVTATATSPTTVSLSWNDVPNEKGFLIERSINGGATFTQLGVTATGVTSFNDTGLTPATAYEYELIALGATGNSPASLPASATTFGPPSAVTASASANGYNDTITWTVSPAASSYLVDRSTSPTSGFTQIANTSNTSFADNGLAPGTFYYEVFATDSAGSSVASNVVTVTTPPAAPTNLVATTGSPTSINLQWNDVTGETGFNILESTSASGPFSQAGSTGSGVTNFTVNGLASSTTYYFEVESLATGAVGTAGPSNVAHAATSIPNPPFATLTTMYGLTNGGLVYSINTATGAAAQIGTLSFGTAAAGRDPYSSNFYYISANSSTVNISYWNPNDNVNTVAATNVSVSGPVAQAAFATDGTFFFTSGAGDLYSFNNDINQTTLLGNIHANGSTLDTVNGDMAFAPNGTLYLETSSELYSVSRSSINAGTGSGSIITATDIGPTGTPNLQIAFGQNGVLFGVDANGQLYSLNTTTGAGATIGAPSGVAMGDLASVPLTSQLTVAQSASSFIAGDNGTYTLTVNNSGPTANVGAITVVDTLPAGLTFTSGSGTGWSFSVSGQTVTMTYNATVAINASAPPITLNVAIGSAVTGSVVNPVTVTSSVFQANIAGNSSSLTTAVSG